MNKAVDNRIELKTTVAGRFKLEAFKGVEDADGNVIEIPGTRRLAADWFDNIITDGGLERMATESNWIGYCQVGTGNTAPAAGNSTLDSYLANTNYVVSYSNSAQATPPYYASKTATYRFAEGVAAGNLSEIAVGWAASGSLYSRALILDGAGSPTTITVLSDEYLDATYQLRIYPPTVDVTGTVDFAGVTYDYIGRAADVDAAGSWGVGSSLITSFRHAGSIGASGKYVYDGDIGSITASGPSGNSAYTSNYNASAYVALSYEREANLVYGLSEGNITAGIRSLLCDLGWGGWQFQFNSQVDGSRIPKDNTKILSISFKHSWARGSI